ncbi:hypothetical protein [Anatilimnocola floriformis]|uniref:hypothetical protein n=1 Tax=Anatilimnocola floriformis TaxID=2948575 RepID=UPI0020C1D96E|nr:hypothetical protein [Anatilimnocola floriformis]
MNTTLCEWFYAEAQEVYVASSRFPAKLAAQIDGLLDKGLAQAGEDYLAKATMHIFATEVKLMSTLVGGASQEMLLAFCAMKDCGFRNLRTKITLTIFYFKKMLSVDPTISLEDLLLLKEEVLSYRGMFAESLPQIEELLSPPAGPAGSFK